MLVFLAPVALLVACEPVGAGNDSDAPGPFPAADGRVAQIGSRGWWT